MRQLANDRHSPALRPTHDERNAKQCNDRQDRFGDRALGYSVMSRFGHERAVFVKLIDAAKSNNCGGNWFPVPASTKNKNVGTAELAVPTRGAFSFHFGHEFAANCDID
jgi:hypothetical protein